MDWLPWKKSKPVPKTPRFLLIATIRDDGTLGYHDKLWNTFGGSRDLIALISTVEDFVPGRFRVIDYVQLELLRASTGETHVDWNTYEKSSHKHFPQFGSGHVPFELQGKNGILLEAKPYNVEYAGVTEKSGRKVIRIDVYLMTIWIGNPDNMNDDYFTKLAALLYRISAKVIHPVHNPQEDRQSRMNFSDALNFFVRPLFRKTEIIILLLNWPHDESRRELNVHGHIDKNTFKKWIHISETAALCGNIMAQFTYSTVYCFDSKVTDLDSFIRILETDEMYLFTVNSISWLDLDDLERSRPGEGMERSVRNLIYRINKKYSEARIKQKRGIVEPNVPAGSDKRRKKTKFEELQAKTLAVLKHVFLNAFSDFACMEAEEITLHITTAADVAFKYMEVVLDGISNTAQDRLRKLERALQEQHDLLEQYKVQKQAGASKPSTDVIAELIAEYLRRIEELRKPDGVPSSPLDAGATTTETVFDGDPDDLDPVEFLKSFRIQLTELQTSVCREILARQKQWNEELEKMKLEVLQFYDDAAFQVSAGGSPIYAPTLKARHEAVKKEALKILNANLKSLKEPPRGLDDAMRSSIIQSVEQNIEGRFERTEAFNLEKWAQMEAELDSSADTLLKRYVVNMNEIWSDSADEKSFNYAEKHLKVETFKAFQERMQEKQLDSEFITNKLEAFVAEMKLKMKACRQVEETYMGPLILEAKKYYIEEMEKKLAHCSWLQPEELETFHSGTRDLAIQSAMEDEGIELTKHQEVVLRDALQDLYRKYKERNQRQNPSNTPAIGIDIGNTNSRFGVFVNNEVRIIGDFKESEELIIPNYVAFKEDGAVDVGWAALRNAHLNPGNTVYDVKRLIGRKLDDDEVQKYSKAWGFQVVEAAGGKLRVRIRDKEYRPEDILSHIISRIKFIAENFLGQQVTKAIITVPAHFRYVQRKAIKDAAHIAGLQATIMDEPVAAAIAYELHCTGYYEKNVLVFSLSRSNFNVAVLTKYGGKKDFKLKSTGEDTQLGGFYFTNNMVDALVRRVLEKYGVDLAKGKNPDMQVLPADTLCLRRLQAACEDGQRRLCRSEVSKVTISCEKLDGRFDLNEEFTREEFNQINNHLFQKCTKIVEETITRANLQKAKIDDIVLVGGSTEVSKIQETLKSYFDGRQKFHRHIKPGQVVIHGAILCASLLDDEPASDLKMIQREHLKLSPTPVIGIHFGTWSSCVGVDFDNRVEIIGSNNPDQDMFVPSCVAFNEGGTIDVGDVAKWNAHRNPQSTISDAKLLIGRKFDDPKIQKQILHWPFEVVDRDNKPCIKIGDQTHTPEQICGKVLEHLKKMVEDDLGHDVQEAVITVPGCSKTEQITAVKAAAKLAGLEASVILEPKAVFLACEDQLNYTDSEEAKRNVLVFNLGGHSLDVTIMSVERGRIRVESNASDDSLGGDHFGNAMMYALVNRVKQKHNVHLARDLYSSDRAKQLQAHSRLIQMKSECEKQKRILSVSYKTSVCIDSLDGDFSLDEDFTRDEFNTINMERFHRCILVIEKALNEPRDPRTRVNKEDIDVVIFAGGSSRIPKVQQLVKNYFGPQVYFNNMVNPQDVAYGAAIQAASIFRIQGELESMRLEEVTPHSLGIELPSGAFEVVIPKGTQFPCYRRLEKYVDINGRLAKKLVLYEGEDSVAAKNNHLGDFHFSNVDHSDDASQKAFSWVLKIDHDQIIHVEAEVNGTRTESSFGWILNQTSHDFVRLASFQKYPIYFNQFLENDPCPDSKKLLEYHERAIVQVYNEVAPLDVTRAELAEMLKKQYEVDNSYLVESENSGSSNLLVSPLEDFVTSASESATASDSATTSRTAEVENKSEEEAIERNNSTTANPVFAESLRFPDTDAVLSQDSSTNSGKTNSYIDMNNTNGFLEVPEPELPSRSVQIPAEIQYYLWYNFLVDQYNDELLRQTLGLDNLILRTLRTRKVLSDLELQDISKFSEVEKIRRALIFLQLIQDKSDKIKEMLEVFESRQHPRKTPLNLLLKFVHELHQMQANLKELPKAVIPIAVEHAPVAQQPDVSSLIHVEIPDQLFDKSCHVAESSKNIRRSSEKPRQSFRIKENPPEAKPSTAADAVQPKHRCPTPVEEKSPDSYKPLGTSVTSRPSKRTTYVPSSKSYCTKIFCPCILCYCMANVNMLYRYLWWEWEPEFDY